MYKTLQEARGALSDWLEQTDREDADAVIEQLLPTLLPVVGFEPSLQSRPGGTRFGGTPDLPPDIDWPVRSVPSDIEDWIGMGGETHGDHIRRYLERPFPFEFFAQVDLAEVAELSGISQILPRDGRLLFFFDLSAGPWREGTEVCRVIWDKTPAEALVSAPEPAAFGEMRAVEREELLSAPNDYNLSHDELIALVPDFVHPPQPMNALTMLQVLPAESLEYKLNGPLQRLVETKGDDGYNLRDEDYSTLYFDQREGARVHQMLGAPVPVQDEPRYSAAALTPEGRAAIEAAGDDWQAAQVVLERLAPDWHLLLQVGVPELSGVEFSEGMVHFLISTDDLKASRFDDVVAIYVQT